MIGLRELLIILVSPTPSFFNLPSVLHHSVNQAEQCFVIVSDLQLLSSSAHSSFGSTIVLFLAEPQKASPYISKKAMRQSMARV